ncbi:angiotensin-converting enzyme isoform X2 [Lepeophtheirus salmonis]|uniref:angiotensin-converting enzyme isoform X2 n=1 Tax=Lepeophtheirus salmonis TaxID=72036 RepID=UPI001AE39176|nr:angiotensin-converting enzyme-like isoform X2 [Lepeophtheirus salmonis]
MISNGYLLTNLIVFLLFLVPSNGILYSQETDNLYLQLPEEDNLVLFEITDPPGLNKESLHMEDEVTKWHRVVNDWFLNLDEDLGILRHLEAIYAWRASADMESNWSDWTNYVQSFKQKWIEKWCSKTEKLREYYSIFTPEESDKFEMVCRTVTPTLSESDKYSESILTKIYYEAQVCGSFNETQKCLHGEPDLASLMEHERNPQMLLSYWSSWREAVGPPSRPFYTKMVDLWNKSVQRVNFKNLGEYWKSQLMIDEKTLSSFKEELSDFYLKLHGYVRHHLGLYYGRDIVVTEDPIPAHLLGNMWAQSWRSLLDIVYSDVKTHKGLGITKKLQELNLTVLQMAKGAENFMTSLGLSPMPTNFWKRSQFTAPKDRTSSCHPSAINMFAPKEQDYRFQMCGEVDEETFLIMHHEMGHIEYYMSYDHLPNVFKDGCHSAFHEAIGDSITYGVLSPQHLARLGITTSNNDPIMHLLYQALDKIPIFFWSLVVDTWRYDVFSGKIKPSDYNDHWWKLRQEIQGVTFEGENRPSNAFDPVSKFHVADNSPYLPYFLSGLLQMQLFKAMCEAEYGYVPDPLFECDIFGSKKAGNILNNHF